MYGTWSINDGTDAQIQFSEINTRVHKESMMCAHYNVLRNRTTHLWFPLLWTLNPLQSFDLILWPKHHSLLKCLRCFFFFCYVSSKSVAFDTCSVFMFIKGAADRPGYVLPDSMLTWYGICRLELQEKRKYRTVLINFFHTQWSDWLRLHCRTQRYHQHKTSN